MEKYKRISFAEYVKENFYDPIFNRVKSYIFGNRSKFDLTSPRIYRVNETTLEDITIQYVNAEDIDPQGTKIAFYPIVLATVGIYGKTHNDYDMDTKDFLFRLRCTADLGNKLDDFKITEIEEYYSKKKYEKPLTDGLVPYIPVEKMDERAEEILKAYYPEVLQTPQKVKSKELAKRMGLRVARRSITEDASVFGQIYFDETVSVLYNRDKDKKERVKVPANTILVDDLASLLFSPTSARLTIAHECVHFEYYFKDHSIPRGRSKKFIEMFGADKTGYGWAGPRMRWCTNRLKDKPREVFLNGLRDRYEIVEYIGIAADELYRLERKTNQKENSIHPLVEWGITEKECLQYCYDHGFDWDGLYRDFKRVSCWCCPLQSLAELRVLYRKYPKLWGQLKAWDEITWRKFRADYSVEELEARFDFEEEWKRSGQKEGTRQYYSAMKEHIKEQTNGRKNTNSRQSV